ncbi:MAG: sulfate ABC transporter substrate-binding protein [Helicobacter sp.]|nr:sulfate ABC transporter substrate-binding protein [Helicobacter sp.]
MLNIKNLGKKAVLSLGLSLALSGVSFAKDYTLLNVSYDPTRELYKEYNAEFSKYYKEKTGDSVKINQSHGGSGSQARSVIDGNAADVVTLALAYDIDAIANADKLKKEWQSSFANDSTPYYSTIVFLVRKGNPKGIKDWSDLVRDDVKVVTPNPKTSGGARWNHLAALGYALKANNGDKDKAREFLIKLYSNVPVLDTGARGATNTFTKRKIGDVLLAWENEAYLALEKLGGQFDIVVPPLSIKAQTPIAVVDSVVDSKGTREVATAYLEHLYSEEAQEIVAKYYYRPSLESVAKKYEAKFPKLELIDINYFGGWDKAQSENFKDGGEFDKIFEAIKAKK